MTSRALASLARRWQKRLRLQDWDVDVGFARRTKMNSPTNVGQCEWDILTKSATIRLLDPMDFDTEHDGPAEFEWTLVHELLHLHFASFWHHERKVEMEQAVDVLASTLVRLAPLVPLHAD